MDLFDMFDLAFPGLLNPQELELLISALNRVGIGASIGHVIQLVGDVVSDPEGTIKLAMERPFGPTRDHVNDSKGHKQSIITTLNEMQSQTHAQVYTPLFAGPHGFQGVTATALQTVALPKFNANLNLLVGNLQSTQDADSHFVIAIMDFIGAVVAFAASQSERVILIIAAVCNALSLVQGELDPITDVAQLISDILLLIAGFALLEAGANLSIALWEWHNAYQNISVPSGYAGTAQNVQAATVDTIYAKWHTKIKGLTQAEIDALLCRGLSGDMIDQLLGEWNRLAGLGMPNTSLQESIADLGSPRASVATGARNLLYALAYLWIEPNFVAQIQSQSATPLGPWNIVGFNIPRVGQNGDVDLIVRTRVNGQVTTLLIEVGSTSKGSEPQWRFDEQMAALNRQAALYPNGTPCVCLVAPNPGGPMDQPPSFRRAITRATVAVGANHVFVIYPPAMCST